MKKIVETSCSIYMAQFMNGPEVEVYFSNDLHENGHLEVYEVENRTIGSRLALELKKQLEHEGYEVTNFARTPRV